jgi:hypothetical protein
MSTQSHTILGSRNQRGLTQLALDLLFRSLSSNILDPQSTTSLHATVAASDASEAQVLAAYSFLDSLYGDTSAPSRASSRAATPMRVGTPILFRIYPLRISSSRYVPAILTVIHLLESSKRMVHRALI